MQVYKKKRKKSNASLHAGTVDLQASSRVVCWWLLCIKASLGSPESHSCSAMAQLPKYIQEPQRLPETSSCCSGCWGDPGLPGREQGTGASSTSESPLQAPSPPAA